MRLPVDAVGIFAAANDAPLQFLNATTDPFLYEINRLSDSEVVAVCKSPTGGHGANYLGAIVSADRATVYWVNETEPLP